MSVVRLEKPDDAAAVREVHRLAFERADEGQLVDALRAGGHARLALVAEEDGHVIGHILFSDLIIVTPQGRVSALALAPLAVIPSRQRHGIGSSLVRDGLRLCAEQGHRVVIVLGYPGYYPRFGFSAELARRLSSPYSGTDSFMALELVAGALEGVAGDVQYPPPFAAL
jgi:putative acetyltransferase